MNIYNHGGGYKYLRDGSIDFSTNINPIGMPTGMEQAVLTSAHKWSHYPDTFSLELRQAISVYESVSSDFILCSNGASDIIFRFVYALRPRKALVLAPSFNDYSRALACVDCDIFEYILKEENNFLVQHDILDILSENDFDVVFICNPNNPTGSLISPDIMKGIISVCTERKIFVMVDECFLDFTEYYESNTVKKFILNSEYLLILKAFTKIFALAGIRLGYCICKNIDLINKLYMFGAHWAVSAIASHAGIKCLDSPEEYLHETRTFVSIERQYISGSLSNLGLKVFDGCSNYVFFKCGNGNLFDLLYNRFNIIIRDCSNYSGLSNGFYRVAVMQHDKNNILCRHIKDVLEL